MALVSSSRVSLTDITTFVFAFGSLLAENLIQIYVLYHIVSYRIVSYRIVSYRITSHRITSHHIGWLSTVFYSITANPKKRFPISLYCENRSVKQLRRS